MERWIIRDGSLGERFTAAHSHDNTKGEHTIQGGQCRVNCKRLLHPPLSLVLVVGGHGIVIIVVIVVFSFVIVDSVAHGVPWKSTIVRKTTH